MFNNTTSIFLTQNNGLFGCNSPTNQTPNQSNLNSNTNNNSKPSIFGSNMGFNGNLQNNSYGQNNGNNKNNNNFNGLFSVNNNEQKFLFDNHQKSSLFGQINNTNAQNNNQITNNENNGTANTGIFGSTSKGIFSSICANNTATYKGLFAPVNQSSSVNQAQQGKIGIAQQTNGIFKPFVQSNNTNNIANTANSKYTETRILGANIQPPFSAMQKGAQNSYSSPFQPLIPKNPRLQNKSGVKCISQRDQNIGFNKQELRIRYLLNGEQNVNKFLNNNWGTTQTTYNQTSIQNLNWKDNTQNGAMFGYNKSNSVIVNNTQSNNWNTTKKQSIFSSNIGNNSQNSNLKAYDNTLTNNIHTPINNNITKNNNNTQMLVNNQFNSNWDNNNQIINIAYGSSQNNIPSMFNNYPNQAMNQQIKEAPSLNNNYTTLNNYQNQFRQNKYQNNYMYRQNHNSTIPTHYNYNNNSSTNDVISQFKQLFINFAYNIVSQQLHKVYQQTTFEKLGIRTERQKYKLLQSYQNKYSDTPSLKQVLDDFNIPKITKNIETSKKVKQRQIIYQNGSKFIKTQSITSKKYIGNQQENVKIEDLPIINSYNIQPSINQLKKMKRKQLKQINNFIIKNQYGSIQFKQPINIYQKNLANCIKIQQDSIEIIDPQLQTKTCQLIFQNFGNYPQLHPKQQVKTYNRMKKWINRMDMVLINFQQHSGRLTVKL